MAGCDYLSCLACGGKAVYDADWYDRLLDHKENPVAVAEALCETCMKTHDLIAVAKAEVSEDSDEHGAAGGSDDEG